MGALGDPRGTWTWLCHMNQEIRGGGRCCATRGRGRIVRGEGRRNLSREKEDEG